MTLRLLKGPFLTSTVQPPEGGTLGLAVPTHAAVVSRDPEENAVSRVPWVSSRTAPTQPQSQAFLLPPGGITASTLLPYPLPMGPRRLKTHLPFYSLGCVDWTILSFYWLLEGSGGELQELSCG